MKDRETERREKDSNKRERQKEERKKGTPRKHGFRARGGGEADGWEVTAGHMLSHGGVLAAKVPYNNSD